MKPHGLDGDKDGAFIEELYRTYAPLMFSAAYEFSVTKAQSEDIVSQTLLKLMKNVSTLRRLKGGALGAYICTCARRCAMDHVSREALRTRREREAASLMRLPDAQALSLDGDTRRVLKAIDRLPPREKACLVQHALSGRSCEEIAISAGLSTATVRRYISRARKRLKKLLKMDGEGGRP
ncbi:MAG: sigma-70 family RNA polymerase sigma factor [Clostridia bacterium]|nr:sigma-70 family RNA polymerase sigma factor [Clostridia bacterium]